MHALTKNLHSEPSGWRIIAAHEVVQRHSKKDFYVQNYTVLLSREMHGLAPTVMTKGPSTQAGQSQAPCRQPHSFAKYANNQSTNH